MMNKLKITQRQYNTILIHEQEARLKANSEVISEGTSESPALLQEGWKEVILTVSLLLGIKLSGLNQSMAQKAIKDEKVMKYVKTTLEDKNKVQELVKSLEEKGIKNPDELLAKNIDKIVDGFNKTASDNKIKYRVGQKSVINLEELGASLKKD